MTHTNDLYLPTNATQTKIDTPPCPGVRCVRLVYVPGRVRGVAKENKKKNADGLDRILTIGKGGAGFLVIGGAGGDRGDGRFWSGGGWCRCVV